MTEVRQALFSAYNAGEVSELEEVRGKQVWKCIHRWYLELFVILDSGLNCYV